MGSFEDDDDVPQLSADTLRMLQEFNAEKEERSKQFEALKEKSENESKLSMDLFGEDWNASQFWYTDQTARLLAHQLLQGATPESAIAVVSTPSVYIALRNILSEQPDLPRPQMVLLEYDQRFEVVGPDFKFYDYNHPLRLPAELKGKFDRIIVDPPFLNEDCQTKAALTARFLAKSWDRDSIRFISCTGERMSGVILKLYQAIGVRTTTFEPKHSKGLSNEFWCYSNIADTGDWSWREF